MTSAASTSGTSRFTLLPTTPDSSNKNMVHSDSDSSVSSSSSSSSSAESESPTTPTSALPAGKQSTFCLHSQESSKSDSSASEDEEQPCSDAHKHKASVPTCSYPEPVFSSIPTRRVQSSNAVFRGPGTLSTMSSCPSSASPNSSPSPTSPAFPRRIPSFPVSRPIRPFDSISNAMGTAPKRVSPPLSRANSTPTAAEYNEKIKQKTLTVQTSGLETGKQKRSNVLLAPPKNNRFQHGFFILDMTQDEFKTRAW